MKKNVWGRLMRVASATAIASVLAAPAEIQAGSHWLSRVTVEHPFESDTIISTSGMASEELFSAMTVSPTAVFDLTISLDANPQGDDDWTVNDSANDADQRLYEERIKAFANAVYQSTNGAHKIGKVTIFREGDYANLADVNWKENCAMAEGPRANTSGFGVDGAHIWMCTNWPGALTLMHTAQGSGYTLAHEWGHFTYGLYDEYAQEQCSPANIAADTCRESIPRGTDTEAVPAIMNNQWRAARGDADYLEHSTQNIHPHRNDSMGENAHKRVYGESTWETLTRDSVSDPKFAWLRPRTQYSVLTAPTAPNWIVHDDESSAQSELDIRWVGRRVVDLLIDRSGSMGGTPLANAKTGANLLINQVQAGTALGVSSFASDVSRDFSITDIPDPDTGVRASAQAAMNALTSSGVTSMYDGLMFSLNGTQAFSPNRPAVVYVLSDGLDNDSTATESNVISAYQSAGVPIIAFAYGSFAPTGTLLNMANATGGAFYKSPTTLADIQAALLAAEAKFSSNVLLSSTKFTASAGAATARPIPMDSTLASARINLSYTGSQTDFDVTLRLPDGADSGIPFVCEGASSCSATLDEAFFTDFGYGDYQIEMVNKTGTDKEVTLLVSATPAGTETYDIAVGFSSKTVNYPADMAIFATVTKGSAIAGLAVTATVTDPTNNTFDLVLLDDGKGADKVADDGTYTASIPYMADGIYAAVAKASNAAGNARTTYEGVNISLMEDGDTWIPASVPITENFNRLGTSSASIAGFMADDHTNDPAGVACTAIADNNADTAGRIDAAGDADCFSFVPGSLSEPVIVRVTSLTSGMDPLLTVYDSSGTLQIAQVGMSTSESPDTGVTVTVPAAELDPAGHVFVVQHADTAAAIGGYVVSAGAALASDNEPPDCSGAEPSIGLLQWLPNHGFIAVDILGVTDPEDNAVTITIESIFQDEAVDANGSGNTAPDGRGVGTPTAEVRAERAAGGNGRVYHIGFTADDGHSGTCAGEVSVGVPHDQGQGSVPFDDGALYDSTVSP